jgi:hypothetical protein
MKCAEKNGSENDPRLGIASLEEALAKAAQLIERGPVVRGAPEGASRYVRGRTTMKNVLGRGEYLPR